MWFLSIIKLTSLPFNQEWLINICSKIRTTDENKCWSKIHPLPARYRNPHLTHIFNSSGKWKIQFKSARKVAWTVKSLKQSKYQVWLMETCSAFKGSTYFMACPFQMYKCLLWNVIHSRCEINTVSAATFKYFLYECKFQICYKLWLRPRNTIIKCKL